MHLWPQFPKANIKFGRSGKGTTPISIWEHITQLKWSFVPFNGVQGLFGHFALLGRRSSTAASLAPSSPIWPLAHFWDHFLGLYDKHVLFPLNLWSSPYTNWMDCIYSQTRERSFFLIIQAIPVSLSTSLLIFGDVLFFYQLLVVRLFDSI